MKDSQKAKEKLIEIGFIAVPDSLSEVHTGQETAGKYFNFLNSYLALIYIYDQHEHMEHHWERLDEFEGEGYQRMITDVTLLENNETIEAFVYALK